MNKVNEKMKETRVVNKKDEYYLSKQKNCKMTLDKCGTISVMKNWVLQEHA